MIVTDCVPTSLTQKIASMKSNAGSRALLCVRLNVYDDFFPNHLSATLAGRQLFVCFNNQGKRVFEVAPNFGKGLALCI